MCVVVVSACSNPSPPQSVSSPAAPQPQTEVTTTALTVSAVNPPIRLAGSDGKTHLEYDLILQSMFNAPVTVTSIEVLGSNGASLLKLDGDDVAKVTTPAFAGPPTAVVAPSAAVGTVIDVVVPSDNVPERLNHRISYRPGTSDVGTLVGTHDIVGPQLDVDTRTPTVISPPLKGHAWLNANSCCVPEAPHRSGRIAVDGNIIKKFEEFAVDWVQLRDGKLFDGDGSRNEQWYGFGADVVAVADGSVAAVFDGMAEQTPNMPATGLRGPRDYSGNHVSLQISPGVWAVYAHLQPGSITVKTGDDVKKGQVIGKLGNSGNSTAPHLHFQLSDGPEITTSNSLPFALDSYRLAGAVDPGVLTAAADAKGVPPPLRVLGPGRQESKTYPLTYMVVDF
jgi:murein DD-endopeptidase MepM/ murein hydrolase activator NlpD